MKRIICLFLVVVSTLCGCASGPAVEDLSKSLYLNFPVDIKLDEDSKITDASGYEMADIDNIEDISALFELENVRQMIYIGIPQQTESFADVETVKNIQDTKQTAMGMNMMAGSLANSSDRVCTQAYPIELTTPHKYVTAPENTLPEAAVLTKAFGFDVDSRIKVNTEIEFDVLPHQSVNVGVYPVYHKYTFEIAGSGSKAGGGNGELYKVVGFCVVIAESVPGKE